MHWPILEAGCKPSTESDAIAPADRYARHHLIDWFSQDAVRAARFGVIGAGAIGNEVVKNLVLLGVGEIDVYDFDQVELHNLTRSIFLREIDVGRSKAQALVERAATVDPNVSLRAIEGDFWQTLRFAHLRRYTALIVCVDNFEARIRANQLALLAGVNMVNAAIDSRYVTVESYPFEAVTEPDLAPACYECALPASVYERLAARYSCGGLKRIATAERKVPTTTITASLAGAMAANAALRFVNAAALGASRIFSDSRTGVSSVVSLTRAALCAGCSATPRRAHFIAGVPHCNGDEVDGDETARLAEPVIWRYRCTHCGDQAAARVESERYELKLAAAFNEQIARCALCNQQSVQIEFRDELPLRELLSRYDGRTIPVRHLLVAEQCFDLQANDNIHDGSTR
jgi:molybdopterin-synthase adenylyltransferase